MESADEFLLSPLEWPSNPKSWPALALARHYGVPTRLLDWTRLGSVAAYFAASDRNAHKDPSGKLVVWALDSEFVARARAYLQPRVCLVTPPRASNPNMHAQAGLFVLWWDDPETTDLADVVARMAERDDEIDGHVPVPVMVRFELPRAEAPKLLRLLRDEQIDAARMFPGYDGVVAAMKQRRLWDQRTRGR
jgi:hypothetical protein